MILFSSKKLECKISNNELSSWEKTKYLIFMVVASSGISGPIYILKPSFGPNPPPWQMTTLLFSCISFVLISYWGIKKCYKTNMRIDDVCFIERFVMLSIPMTMKFISFFFSAFVVYCLILAYIMDGKDPSDDFLFYSSIFAGIIAIIASIVYYIFLNRSFHRLALLMKTNNEP
jgi:hypothetical protein